MSSDDWPRFFRWDRVALLYQPLEPRSAGSDCYLLGTVVRLLGHTVVDSEIFELFLDDGRLVAADTRRFRILNLVEACVDTGTPPQIAQKLRRQERKRGFKPKRRKLVTSE